MIRSQEKQEAASAHANTAMNRHYEMHGIQRRHFDSTAQTVGYASTAEPIIEELLARTPAAIAEVQTDRRPKHSVGCRRKQAKSRAFQGKFERANMQPDRR